MKKLKLIQLAFLALVLISAASSHEDEFGETSAFHFFHTGKLIFPIWTYWAEIVEHFAIIVAVSIGLILTYKLWPDKRYKLFVLGLGIIFISETFTLLHHFLIFPLGIFNAVFHHGLLFFGILMLVLGILKRIKGE